MIISGRPALPRRFKSLIGEIVMVGGEIDQIIISALMRSTNVTPLTGLLLFSKTNISTNFKNLRYLVEADGDDVLAAALDKVDLDLQMFSRARNTFAHGAFIERSGDDISFSVLSDYSVDATQNTFGNRVSIYDEESLRKYIVLGEQIVNDVRKLFQVRMLHEAPSIGYLSDRPLSPREIRKNRNSKQRRPPRPSQA